MSDLWADLINSNWRDHRGTGACEDRIGNDAWLAVFLERTSWDGDHLPTAADREALRQMREFLGHVVEHVRQGRPIMPDDVEHLNQWMAGAPVLRRLKSEGNDTAVILAPFADGIEAILGEVAASFATMLAEGDPTRIKICANTDCGWVIYDTSRNRTRRWCDKTECGNLIKVRRHRQRKREQANQASR
jgi:predicted RNA-binding Zn ribbon-like protein